MLNAKTATAIALAFGLVTGAPAIAPAGTAEQRDQPQIDQPAGPSTQQRGATSTPQVQRKYTVSELKTRADELVGQDVVNLRGKAVGELQDIVVEKQNNEPYAVIEVGGVLGIGAKDVALPFEELQLGEKKIILMSLSSEEQLKAMPEYKVSDYTSLRGGSRQVPR
ncbi:MAG: PRC-barrel domain-containing protein [Defluviicoccus sp.]